MLLPNGLQTIEVGSTAWRIILNHLITNIYTQQEIDNMVENAVEPELIFVSNLPTSGDITKLYIVTSTNLLYRWNVGLNAFVSVGGSSSGGSGGVVIATTLPSTGEVNKLYVNTTNNRTYIWSGSAYVEVSPSLGGAGDPSVMATVSRVSDIGEYYGSAGTIILALEGGTNYRYTLTDEAIPSTASSVEYIYVNSGHPSYTATKKWKLVLTSNIDSNLFLNGASTLNQTTQVLDLAKLIKNVLTTFNSATVNIASGLYYVGEQEFAGAMGLGYAFRPKDLFVFDGTNKNWSITINGNGAKFKYVDGLKHGSYDPVTGNVYPKPVPEGQLHTNLNYLATMGEFFSFLHFDSVAINDVYLDGNAQNCLVGGKWGDYDWQCDQVGFIGRWCKNVSLKNVHCDNFALDGFVVSNREIQDNDVTYLFNMEGCTARNNARQGMSYVGGNHGTFTDCVFGATGFVYNTSVTRAREPLVNVGNPSQDVYEQQGMLYTNPGCGIDIEAEDSINRNIVFKNCVFEDCVSKAIVSSTGESSDYTFENCKILGSVNVTKPRVSFNKCVIKGYILNPYVSPNGYLKFKDCYISDKLIETRDYPDLASFPATTEQFSFYYRALDTNKLYLRTGITGTWVEQVGVQNFISYKQGYGRGLFASELGDFPNGMPPLGHTYVLDGCVFDLEYMKAGVLRNMYIKDTNFVFRYRNDVLQEFQTDDSWHLAIFEGSILDNIKIVNNFKDIIKPATMLNRAYIEISGVQEIKGRTEIIKNYIAGVPDTLFVVDTWREVPTATDMISWRYRVPFTEQIEPVLGNKQDDTDPTAQDKLRLFKSFGSQNQETGFIRLYAGNNPTNVNLAGEQGDIIFNESPSVGEAFAWTCTTAGVSGSAIWTPVDFGGTSGGGAEDWLYLNKRYPAGSDTTVAIGCDSNPIADSRAGELGDFLFNEAPSTTEAFGWMCTTAGASGVAVWTALFGKDQTVPNKLEITKVYPNGTNPNLRVFTHSNPISDNPWGNIGDFIINEQPSVNGEAFGWICTTTGGSGAFENQAGSPVWTPLYARDLTTPTKLEVTKVYPSGTNPNVRIFTHSNPISDNPWGNIGDIIFNEQPASGEAMGWICTVTGGSGAFENQAGSPVWRPLANIS